MAIIAVLLSVALPIYNRSIIRAKESVLKNNLFERRLPAASPIDPITGTADSWKIIMEDASNTVNQSEPGIFDVRSGSDKTSLEGTPYSDW